jgi:hypothetical protein
MLSWFCVDWIMPYINAFPCHKPFEHVSVCMYVCMWSTSLELFFHFMIILIIAMELKLWFDWYVYGWGMASRLDLHLPGKIDEPKPVVIFVTGGAWIIGYCLPLWYFSLYLTKESLTYCGASMSTWHSVLFLDLHHDLDSFSYNTGTRS